MRMRSTCGSGTLKSNIVQEGAIEVTVNYVAITVIITYYSQTWSSATGNYCKTIQSVNSSEMVQHNLLR